MDTLRQDFRYAWRSLRSRRAFTTVALLTLALGIGATTAMFSVVRGVVLAPLPYPEAERIVAVWESTPEEVGSLEAGLLSHPNYLDLRSEASTLASIALHSTANLTVSGEEGAELVRGGAVTRDFFRVFRTPLLMGRAFTAEEDVHPGPDVAIVSEGYWRDRLAGRADPVGSTIRIDGRPHEIVGVAPAGFDFPLGARLWVPIQNDDEACGRGCVTRGAVARLTEGASLESARAELEGLAARLEREYPETNANTTFAAATLRDVVVGDVRSALWLLLGAVAMVLLIACANVANLLLVRGRGRTTELAVRSALGADRGRIVAQLMTESALLALLGGAIGLLLARWGVGRLIALAPADIPRLDAVGLDPLTLGAAGLLVAITTLLFGLAPALSLSRLDLASSIRRAGPGAGRGPGSGGRSAILACEVALSVLLLTGAGLLLRSMMRVTDVRAGFETTGVAAFRLSLPRAGYPTPDDRVRFIERLEERLATIPGAEEVGVMLAPPLAGVSLFGGLRRVDRPPPAPGREPAADYRAAGPGALELLGIPIVAGRRFEESDRDGARRVVLVNEAAAERYFPGEDPVGRRIEVQISTGYAEDVPRTIVGVYADFRGGGLTREPGPEMIVPYAQAGASFPHLLLRGSQPEALLAAARRELRSLDPELPFVQAVTMDELLAAQLARPRFYLVLLGLFACLAVTLAAVGLYGVVAYAVSRRRSEIGVRMALGARAPQVVRLVLWQGMRPALAGLAIGAIGAYWGGRLLEGLLYRVGARDPVTFAAVPLLLLLVALLACAVPARRATRIPPATALRAD